MTLVNDCQMFKLRCPEWKLAKDIRRLPFSEGIKCYIITYIYTVLESTTVYTLYTGLPANLKTLLYLDLQQNAIFCHHMLLLYHNFIALNENPIFAGMNPFNFACQNPLSEQLSHSTVQCSSTWVDMRVWVLRGESGTRMKSARNSFVKPGAPMMLLN